MFDETQWDVALRPNPVGPGLLEKTGPCEPDVPEYDEAEQDGEGELDETEDDELVIEPAWDVRADAKRRSGEEDEEDFEDEDVEEDEDFEEDEDLDEDFEDDEFEEDEDLDEDVEEDVGEDEDV